jgi:hypothetical protein
MEVIMHARRFWIIPLLILLSCGGETMKSESVRLPSLNDITEETWAKLAEKRIFFGHQSVGDNIIKGINRIKSTREAVKLNIVEIGDAKSFNQPGLAHASVGKNDDPESKILAFRDYMKNGIGEKADMAFFKFCFWDIRNMTDIRGIFEEYKTTLAELKSQYPKTVFIHATVPLMVHPDGVKNKIRRVLGRRIEQDMDNVRRNELNDLILNEYLGKDPILDIAQAESVLPGGARTFFVQNGKKYYFLASEYTRDGGHLNEEGQERVAEQFLITLAKIAEKL